MSDLDVRRSVVTYLWANRSSPQEDRTLASLFLDLIQKYSLEEILAEPSSGRFSGRAHEHWVKDAQYISDNINDELRSAMWHLFDILSELQDNKIIDIYQSPPGSSEDYFQLSIDADETILTDGRSGECISEQEFSLSPRIPAAGRFVSRTDNLDAVEHTEKAVASAIGVIEDSNTLAPEEKSLWVDLLRQGLEGLKDPKVLIAGISALLAKPLYDAYASVIEESAKPLVQSALDAVLKLIGLA